MERSASYQGTSIYLISKDHDFYHVNATANLGLIDQRHVGPAEYRGKIRIDDANLLLR